MSAKTLISVRPVVKTPKADIEVKCRICGVGDDRESDADDENVEAIKVKQVKNVYLPSQMEIDEHNLNHLPFRGWCPYCVQGKGVSASHKRRKKEENEVPVIAIDYMGLKKREPEEGENPIIVDLKFDCY